MSATTVTLSGAEFHAAVSSAALRMAASRASGLNAATTYARTWNRQLAEEVCGACGEMAVAKFLGSWFVPSLNTFHAFADVFGIEVRATELPGGSLIVRDNDAQDRRYVLAIVQAPRVTLAGWIVGADARREEWQRDPHDMRPAWFVPQSALRLVEELEA